MHSNDEAVTRFKEILGSKEGWRYLKDSQFVHHLATFQAWALRAAEYAAERALQEFYLSTALNRSSISAQAEDKGYLPRLPEPSSGGIQIKNTGSDQVDIPALQSFQSNKSIPYLIKYPVVVNPGETVEAIAYQLSIQNAVSTIEASIPFIEILFAQSLTQSIHQIDVYVDEDGSGYTQWSLSRLFRNTLPDSKAYDLFYSHSGQIGIRFGNGVFGKIPEQSSSVKCVLWLTEGNTVLLETLPLQAAGAIVDVQGQPAKVEIKTVTQISGGFATEGTEELRKNLTYWPLYDDELVWGEDYVFFLNRKIPGILWIKVWGEAEAERESGQKRSDHINSIFVSAYKPGEADLQTRVLQAFENLKLFSRWVKWVNPAFVLFDVSITGKIARKYTIDHVSTAARAAISAAYGKDSATRRDTLNLKDCYKIISGTGYFDDNGSKFEITVTGPTATARLHEMLCVGSISCSLEYV